MSTRSVPSALAALTGLATLLTGQSSPPESQAEAAIAGGKVGVHHYPVALRPASLESIQRRGTVWSMGDREAARLTTTVALLSGKTLIPPGSYRMSTWFKRRGQWRLLIFSRGKNYRSGTPYFEVPLRIRELEQPSPTVRLAAEARGETLRLELFGGTSRLRAEVRALPVSRHDGTIAGRPAVYEFYGWPAVAEVHQRLRNLEPVQFGRIRDSARFGILYELTCRNDGKAVFVDAKSSTLRDNRTLLRETIKRRQDAADDRTLAKRQADLERAIAIQVKLQPNVIVAASVLIEPTKAPTLAVQFTEAKSRDFELLFGMRRVTFSITDAQFKRLSWK